MSFHLIYILVQIVALIQIKVNKKLLFTIVNFKYSMLIFKEHTVKPRNLRPRSLRTPQICSWYFVPTPPNLLLIFRKSADFFV